MKLLDFVAIYGFVLMPMGAVIFIDFYVIRKLGLHDFYAGKAAINFNWAAGLAWFITLMSGLALNLYLGVEVFFLGLPGWFIAAIIFIIVSYIIQKRDLSTVKT